MNLFVEILISLVIIIFGLTFSFMAIQLKKEQKSKHDK